MRRFAVPRTLASLVCALVVFGALPALAQTTEGAGKLELAVFPAGWVSFAESDNESAFSQFLFGGAFTVNWSWIGIEGDLFMGVGRTQDLQAGSTTTNQKTPHVSPYSVNAVVPLMGNARRVIPYAVVGIGEMTIMRTSDNVLQPDTETFTMGSFGGGVKWYTAGRWGFRADYRYNPIRSKFASPGSFFGEELRKAQQFYAGFVVRLIPLTSSPASPNP
jgi:hypothetical protein